MFAILDIETTGLDPKNDRITEIAICVHDGLSVVDQFATLIQPGRSIPPHISRITGITDAMVLEAPKFYEVAKTILDYTRDRIVVAHNVEFDYRFIQEEFRSLGYVYKRDKLCTVKLSKKLIPGKRSYALGRLCEALNIPLSQAHRAEADARATAALFSYLMQLKSAHPLYKTQNLEAINTGRVEKIQQYILQKLPERTGVYRFLNREREIIYIGKSTNLRQRAIQHYNSKEKKSRRMIGEIYNVEYEETGSELIALLLESEEIKRFQPRFNRSRKKQLFSYAIVQFSDENGILNLRIVPASEAKAAFRYFHSWISARSFLNDWMDHHFVCPKFCVSPESEGPCFNVQIRTCKGICCGKEDAESYNSRIAALLNEHQLGDDDRMIYGEGRYESEYSFVLVLNGKFAGYGYLHKDVEVNAPSELANKVVPFEYWPDADEIIRGWERRMQEQNSTQD